MIKRIHIPIYNVDVIMMSNPRSGEISHFMETNNIELPLDDRSELKDAIGKVVSDAINGFTMRCIDANLIMCVDDSKHRGTVAHEIFHVAQRVLNSRGVEMGEDGESYAYLIGWLTEKFYEKESE